MIGHLIRSPGDTGLVQAIGTKYGRIFWPPKDWSTGPGAYNFNNHNLFGAENRTLDQFTHLGIAPVLTILTSPKWNADRSYSGGRYAEQDPPKDFIAYQRMVYDGLKYEKTRYSNFVYLEVWNEPDGNWKGKITIPISEYSKMYHYTALAVKAANTLGLPGPPIKIGGPCAYDMDAGYIGTFLDNAKANGDPVDFVSWHDYGHTNGPAELESDTNTAKRLLSSRGMNAQTIVTEFNGSSGGGNAAPTAAASARNAAFAAAGNYYYMKAGLTHAFWFALYDNRQAPLLQYYYNAPDGTPLAPYNAYKMMSMQKSNVVFASSDSLKRNGTGIGVEATEDSSGVAVLVWNYQSSAQSVTVKVNNLPSTFSEQTIRVQQYLVDGKHSNYLYNGDKALDKVADFTAPAGPSLIQNISLSTNAVTLFVLAPSGTVADLFRAGQNVVASVPSGGLRGGGPARANRAIESRARLRAAKQRRQGSHRLPELLRYVERRRPGHSGPHRRQIGIRKLALGCHTLPAEG